MTAFGTITFGATPIELRDTPDVDAQVTRMVVDQGGRADELGIDAYSIGEHHRLDIPVSSPDVLLAAIAGRTSHVALGSAVTVLSSDDPVRVYQRFASLDAISDGRAEPILGRGSFTESFPLFGYDLHMYNELFEEKLELYARLRTILPTVRSSSTPTATSGRWMPSSTRPAHGTTR